MKIKSIICLILIIVGIYGPITVLAEQESVTINYWTDPRFQNMEGKIDVTQNPGDYERLLAEEFEEKYPHVNIEVQAIAWEDLSTKVVTAIRGGNQPDILKDYLGRTSYYAYQGLLEPLDKYISEEELDNYLETYIDYYTIQGHLHGLPSYAWAQGMVINKQIWKEKGKSDLLPMPESYNWTFSEFEKAIEEVKEEDQLWPFGFRVIADGQADYAYLNMFYGMGGKVYSEDNKEIIINSPENIRALEFLIRLKKNNLIPPGWANISPSDHRQMFWKEQTAVMDGSIANFTQKNIAKEEGNLAEPFDMDIVNYPHAEGVTNGVAIGPTGFVVFKQKDDYKRKWTIKFAQWLNNKENQEEYVVNAGQYPTRKDVATPAGESGDISSAYKQVDKLIENRGVNDLGLLSPAYNEIRTTYAPIIQQIIQETISPEEGLAQIEERGNQILDKAWERLPENIWE